MKPDLVYEIGTEEIPAGYLPPAARQLKEEAVAFLREHRLAAGTVETHATPRRLVLFVENLPRAQDDRTEEVTGPPWKAAFDADGKPTKAAEGFARGRGLSVSDLRRVETERGPYAGATVEIPGRPTLELLASALPEITARLAFPKTMHWGPEHFRFARPIRWILALLGKDVVPFEIEGVKSGRVTYGHRILAKGPFEVKSAADYEKALKKGLVVLRASDRAKEIGGLLEKAAKAAGGRLVPDPELVEEVSYLVEPPSAFASDFDEEFLELPAPVVTTAMRDHQRYFAIEGEDGRLLPRFLCVANSAPKSVDAVKEGNRRVLRARLDDARFYWNEDLKTTLEEKVPDLERVIIAGGFGQSLNPERAMVIGLLPEMDLERVTFVGNGSLLGCRLVALSNPLRAEVGGIVDKMTNFELAAAPTYMDNYTSSLFFPHTEAKTLFPKASAMLEAARVASGRV